MYSLIGVRQEKENLPKDRHQQSSSCCDSQEHFDAVLPGYHMSKKHWNTIIMDGSLGDDLIRQWIDDSYFLVAGNLTKKQKQEIGF